jgi:hypothetical protein
MPAEPTPVIPEWSYDDKPVLLAVDAGWQDCDSGLVSPLAEVESMVHLWISKYSSPTKP